MIFQTDLIKHVLDSPKKNTYTTPIYIQESVHYKATCTAKPKFSRKKTWFPVKLFPSLKPIHRIFNIDEFPHYNNNPYIMLITSPYNPYIYIHVYIYRLSLYILHIHLPQLLNQQQGLLCLGGAVACLWHCQWLLAWSATLERWLKVQTPREVGYNQWEHIWKMHIPSGELT